MLIRLSLEKKYSIHKWPGQKNKNEIFIKIHLQKLLTQCNLPKITNSSSL